MRLSPSFCAIAVGCILLPATIGSAQQVQLTSPYHQLRDSFYENFGLGWGIQGRSRGPGGGFSFNTGPRNSAPPPFGGWDPAADATFGAGFAGNGFSGGFGFGGGTGSTRSNVMESATLVLPNGGSAGLFSGSQRPFVTSVVPVVGEGGVFSGETPGVNVGNQASTSPIQERLARLRQGELPSQHHATAGLGADAATAGRNPAEREPAAPTAAADSTANHGDLSVAEIRRQQSAEDANRRSDIADRIEKARSYEDAGKPAIAKIYYQQAAARATGEQKQQLLEKVQSLSRPASP